MRLLVTRPEADSQELVRALEARGHSAEIEPLLHIHVRHDQPVELDGVRTLLVTSANGVRAFAELSDERNLRVLAVGEASAEAARKAGFTEVESANGDAEALAELAIAHLDPEDGTLFHAAGSVTAGKLKEKLTGAGFDVRRVPLYDAVPSNRLSPEARSAIADGRIDGVLFFSPRTAQVFVRLAYDDDLADACGGMEAICLSQAVAGAVQDLPWRGVRVADYPDRDALLDVLDRDAPRAATNDSASAATKGAMTQDPNDPKTDAASDQTSAEAGGATGNAALEVIQRFGGIRPMAHKMGVAVSTVQGWKNRGAIPESRHDEILEAARKNDIALDPALLQASGDVSAVAEARESEHAVAAEAEAAAATEETREAAANEHAVGAEAEAASWGGEEEPFAERRGEQAEPAAAAPPPPATPARPGGWLPGMFLGAAILVVGVAAAIGTRESWLPYVEGRFKLTIREEPAAASGELQTTVADLADQVARLEDRMAQVQDGGGASGAALEDLRQRIGGLESSLSDATGRMNQVASRMENASGRMDSAVQRIDSLTARVENQAGRLEEIGQSAASTDTTEELTQQLAQIEDQVARLTELQERIRSQADVREAARRAAGQVAAKTLAVAELRDALRFSAPFQQQLAAARAVMQADSALAQSLQALAPMADSGVPTRAELANAFDRAAREAVAADQGASEDGMLGGVLKRLNDVVTVRKVGQDAEGSDASAVLARAEAKLEAGDLGAAVATVETLPDAAKEAMSGWVAQAESRLKAEQALSAISADLMQQLTQAGGGAEAASTEPEGSETSQGGGSN